MSQEGKVSKDKLLYLAISGDGVFLFQEGVDILISFAAEKICIATVAVQVSNGAGCVTWRWG